MARDVHPRHAAPRARQSRKKSKAPLILMGLLCVCFVGICGFALSGGFAPKEPANQPQSPAPANQPQNQAPATAPSAEAGAGETIISLKGGDKTIVLRGEDYIEPGCTATDAKDGMISQNVKISGKVDTSKAGDYTVTYSVKNSRNQTVKRERTVHVVESMDTCTKGVPVLMYHYVYSNDDPPESNDVNYISDTDLEAQLQWLTENDYYYPSFAELRAYVDGKHSLPEKSVILSFDDGEYGCLQLGGALMEKYKVPMISFTVCVDNADVAWLFPNPYIVYESHSYDMHRDPTTIGHGGVIHIMSKDQIVNDLSVAANILTSKDAFAYPYGDVPEAGMEAVAETGTLCAFTTNYGFAHVGDDFRQLSRIRVLGNAGLSSFISSIEG